MQDGGAVFLVILMRVMGEGAASFVRVGPMIIILTPWVVHPALTICIVQASIDCRP
jgi:hypothetical protein